jgi:uncharacterized protein (DUF1330 family)
MAKAYWIARVDVRNPDAYKLYVEAGTKAFAKHNAKFLARGGKAEALEGPSRARNVIIEFESLDAARACYNSPEYAEARAHRAAASVGEIVIVEGV